MMMHFKAVTPAQQTGGQAVTTLQKKTLYDNLEMLSIPIEFLDKTNIIIASPC